MSFLSKSKMPVQSPEINYLTPTVSVSEPVKRVNEDADAKLTERFGKVRNKIDAGASVQGRVVFSTTTKVDGFLSGEVQANQCLLVGSSGEVHAQIKGTTIVILGRVKGDIDASERVEVMAGGSVEGAIVTPVIVLEEGCSFNGTCVMRAKETKIIQLEPSEKVESPRESSSMNASNEESGEIENELMEH